MDREKRITNLNKEQVEFIHNYLIRKEKEIGVINQDELVTNIINALKKTGLMKKDIKVDGFLRTKISRQIFLYQRKLLNNSSMPRTDHLNKIKTIAAEPFAQDNSLLVLKIRRAAKRKVRRQMGPHTS